MDNKVFIYHCCPVQTWRLYCSEFQISVYTLPEDGGFPSKHVAVNKQYVVTCIICVYHLEDPGVDGRILFKWIFRKLDRGTWNLSSWFSAGNTWRTFLNACYRGADKSLARIGRKQDNDSFRMAWISFSALPYRGKENLMRASRCCWNRGLP